MPCVIVFLVAAQRSPPQIRSRQYSLKVVAKDHPSE
jgi:hypothetical protein